MTLPANPYIAGAPLRGEKGFFGRQDTLDWVQQELRNPQTNALVLFGQRRIGKTARDRHATIGLPGGRVLLAAGASGSAALATCEVYDTSAGTWLPQATLATARDAAEAVPLLSGQ